MQTESQSTVEPTSEIFLIGHQSLADAKESAMDLARLSIFAQKLLAEIVEHSGVKRKKLSKAAQDLEDSGFVIARAIGNIGGSEFELVPTLAGEEALEIFEGMSRK